MDLNLSDSKAKHLFWRLVSLLEDKEYISTQYYLTQEEYESRVSELISKIKVMQLELKKVEQEETDRVRRVKELEEKVKSTAEDAGTKTVMKLSKKMHKMQDKIEVLELKRTPAQARIYELEQKIQIYNVEKKILELEQLHNNYSDEAPELRKELTSIKRKIKLAKTKLKELKAGLTEK